MNQQGKLVIRLNNANLAEDKDLFGKMDPYIKIECGK